MPRPLRLFAVTAAVLFAAWLPKLVPNAYSVDDYILLHGEPLSQTLRMYAAQGRFGMALLHLGLTQLGASPIHAYTLLHLASVLLLAAAAVLLVRVWDLEGEGPLPFVIAPLAFIHPFSSETWSFRIAPIYFAIAMALALGGLWLIRRGRGRTLVGAALIVASLSVYQVGLNPLLVAIGIGACLDLWRVGSDREAVRATLRVWLLTFAIVLAACLAYFALMKLLLLALGIGAEQRAGFLQVEDVAWRAKQVWRLLPRLLGRDAQLGSPLQGALQLGLLALALGLAAVKARGEGVAKAGLTLLLLFLSLLAVIGLHAALGHFQPWPRSLTGAGLFWSGVVALAWLLAGARLRGLALGAALLLGFGYLGVQHRVAAEQLRLNAREQLLASRILERLEANAQGGGVRRMVTIGHAPAWPDLETAGGDLNVSALFIPWSQAALVAEVSGRPLGPASDADRALAGSRCALAPKWPADGAVAVEGELGIVCF